MPAFRLVLAPNPHPHPHPQTSSETDVCVHMAHWGRLSAIALGGSERGRMGQREKLPCDAGGTSALSWELWSWRVLRSVLKQRWGAKPLPPLTKNLVIESGLPQVRVCNLWWSRSFGWKQLLESNLSLSSQLPTLSWYLGNECLGCPSVLRHLLQRYCEHEIN